MHEGFGPLERSRCESSVMKRFALARVPALAGILATFYPSHAASAEVACAGLRLEVEGALERRFPDLAESVRAAFSARDDTDACPQVRLTFADPAIQLEVALADGRSTVRSLARPEDVVPTLQALVIVPERPEAANSSPPARAGTSKQVASERSRPAHRQARRPASGAAASGTNPTSDRGLVAAPPDAFEPSDVRIELSTFLGAHSGEDGRSSLNFGVSALLDVHRFLGGLQLRVDQYQGMAQGQGNAFELAALLGRRFDLEIVGLDLLIGPSAAFQGSSGDSQDVSATEMRSITVTNSATEADENAAYVCAAARGSLFPHSALRPFVAADAALRLDEHAAHVAPLFPEWALGVSIGVTVGTL